MGTSSDRLQLNEDLAFQHREWRFQRAGWWALTVFVAAALLGLFGGGPLSRTSAIATDGSLRVDYERFVRAGTVSRVVIHAPAATGGTLQLHLDRVYVDALRIDHIVPEPSSIDVGPARVVLRFTSSSAEPFTVTLDAEPLHAGRHATAVAVDGHAAVTIRQFAYF